LRLDHARNLGFLFLFFFLVIFFERIAIGAAVAKFIHLVVTCVEGLVKGHFSSWILGRAGRGPLRKRCGY